MRWPQATIVDPGDVPRVEAVSLKTPDEPALDLCELGIGACHCQKVVSPRTGAQVAIDGRQPGRNAAHIASWCGRASQSAAETETKKGWGDSGMARAILSTSAGLECWHENETPCTNAVTWPAHVRPRDRLVILCSI